MSTTRGGAGIDQHRAILVGIGASLGLLGIVWGALEVAGLRSEVRAFASVNATAQGSVLESRWRSGGLDRIVTTGRGLLEDREDWIARHRAATDAALAALPRD